MSNSSLSTPELTSDDIACIGHLVGLGLVEGWMRMREGIDFIFIGYWNPFTLHSNKKLVVSNLQTPDPK